MARQRVTPTQQSQQREVTPRSQKTRQAVIMAAAECIARDGYAATSTTAIADRAAVSWGVLQYHFGDRNGLMVAVLDAAMDNMAKVFSALSDKLATIDDLETRLTTLVQTGWSAYTTPLSLAATEIVINLRGTLDEDPELQQKLVAINKQMGRLGQKAIATVIDTSSTASFDQQSSAPDKRDNQRSNKQKIKKITGIYLAALRGFASGAMQHIHKPTYRHERDMLVELLYHHLNSP